MVSSLHEFAAFLYVCAPGGHGNVTRPLDVVFEEVLGRVHGESGVIANDPRFAPVLYRITIRGGMMDQIGFIGPV